MSKGYVYIMTSTIEGLIKIGKTKEWTRRCQSELETDGYKNINGLKTYFVVECDNYDEIENIMHDIFRESRVSNIEAFAVDKDRAKRVLSKMGNQVYPEIISSKTTKITQKVPKNNNSNNINSYFSFWNKFNTELRKCNSSIQLNHSSFTRSYHAFSNKNKIQCILQIRHNCFECSFRSDDAEVFNSLILSKLDNVNRISNIIFTNSTYTKTSGSLNYNIKSVIPINLENYSNNDIIHIISSIEPVFNMFMS